MNRTELVVKRADHFSAADKLIKTARVAGKDLTGADLEQYQAHIQEMKSLDKLIARCDEIVALGTEGKPKINPGSMLGGYVSARNDNGNPFRTVFDHETAEEREQIVALASFLSGNIRAAADLTPSGDGGYLIPSVVQSVIERNYAQFAPVISVARVWSTDTGEPATFPVLSDTESAVQLAPAAATGADATVSGDTPPTDLTGPQLKAWKISSKPVFIPRETLTDGVVDVVTEVLGALLARIIRYENLQYTKGDGTTEAEGFLTNCSTHAAGAVAMDLDIALDLAYACPAIYRPNGVFMLSDTSAKYLRKLKTGITGDKRQLWADADATKGTPATLHGYPVYINNDMDDVASDGTFAAKSPLAFGDFKRFVVRRAEMGQSYIYRYPVPAKDGQAVIMFRRSDSKLLVPEAIVKLTVS